MFLPIQRRHFPIQRRQAVLDDGVQYAAHEQEDQQGGQQHDAFHNFLFDKLYLHTKVLSIFRNIKLDTILNTNTTTNKINADSIKADSYNGNDNISP